MTASTDVNEPLALTVSLTPEMLIVELVDGRKLSVPISWYPRLEHGNKEERENWELTPSRHGIHWPDLDEDISVSGLLAGKPSNESAEFISRWLSSRRITKS